MQEVKRTFREFLALIALGLVTSLIANTASPDGLSLTNNYFRKPVLPPKLDTLPGNGDTGSRPGNGTTTKSGNGDEPKTEEEMVRRLKERGFQALYHQQVLEDYNSPYRTDGLYVFIDARSDANYKTGHLPGVYQLDHYYIDRYINTVLEACKIAEKIVVYCNGGTCEDSELVVGDLMEKGLEPHKLFIYAGGFSMWKDKGKDIEIGERNSGQITRYPPKNGVPATQEAKK